MTNKISVRQICFIMLAYTAVSKFILYPTVLSYQSGRDLLFSALFDFLIQGVIIWSVSFLCSRTDKTLFELIEDNLGNITARIVYGLFAAFFIICTIVPLFEQKVYVHAIFYDTVPSLSAFIPFFFFALYAASKGFQNIGRSADICFPVFLLSMLFIIGMSVLEVRWDNFLPVLKTPLKDVAGASLGTTFRFFEPCWLLMFMGHFKYKKGDAAKITLSYVGGAVMVILILAIFYGVYGDISASRQFAISKISLFFPAIETVGRVDLLALYALEIVMLFSLVLNLQLAVHCISKCTGYDNSPLYSIIINAGLVLLLVLLDNKFNDIHTFFASWMWIAFLIFANIIPLLCWALRRRKAND